MYVVVSHSLRGQQLLQPRPATSPVALHPPSPAKRPQVLDKRHEHELLPSAAPFHVTRAAPSAEAAAAAAKALHVTEELDEAYNHDDLG